MFNVEAGKKKFSFDRPMSVEGILKNAFQGSFVAALVDGELTDLSTQISTDCSIAPLGLESEDGQRVYVRTLKYVLIMSVRRLFPEATVRFLYSISKGLYCEAENISLDEEKVAAINGEMQRLISEDLEIKRERMSTLELEKLYLKTYPEKVKLLKYAGEEQTVYHCGDEYNYLNGAMMPKTGFIREYKLYFRSPGMVLLYPRSDEGGKLPEYEESVQLDRMLREEEEWGKICGVRDIADLNARIESGKCPELVNMCEIKHENDINRISSEIAGRIRSTKVVLIAGPSSSGKTTLAKRLQLHLAVKGIKATRLSTDDFFYPINVSSRAELEKMDLEHIDRVDVPLFNKTLSDLISGREVLLPEYDFGTNKRKDGAVCSIGKDECIIIEGIHGLNEQLTQSVPRYGKYKIYISALTHINLDVHTPVSTTTMRLIRRAVRDGIYRNFSVANTFSLWNSVRRGEFRWIYPYHDEADFTFNSALAYEPAVLKKHIMPLIESVGRDNEFYYMTDKIKRVMRFVEDVGDDVVPNTSILREFIGNGNY